MKSKKMIQQRKPQKQLMVPQSFEAEVIAVVKQSIAPDLTDAELKVYLGVCRQHQANPIMKDIVPVVFNTKKGRVLNFIISRNFLLKVAHKSKELDGMTSKVLRDAKGNIIGATAELWKKGCQHSFQTEVSFKEYYNDKNELWGKFPGAMIKKVAEVIVLKQAWGIDMLCETEMEKGNGAALQISDIQIPKTRFTVSDQGRVRAKLLKVEKNEKNEEEVL